MLVQLSRSWVRVPTHRSACAAAGTATRRAFAPMENVVHAGPMPGPWPVSGIAEGLASFPAGSDYLSVHSTVAIQDVFSRIAQSAG